MTKQTRFFMLSSAAVLVVGLCTVLVAYYGGMPVGEASQVSVSASELRYVPADASVVAFANVREVMDSDLRRRLQDGQTDDNRERQREFEDSTGISLETDVDRVVATMVRRGDDGDGVAIVSGRFNPTQLEAFGRAHGATLDDYRSVRLVRGGRDDDTVLAFVEPGVVIFGDADGVLRAIDAREDGPTVETNADLMRLVDEIEPNANAWAVGRFDELASQADLPDNVTSQIPPIQWFSASGRVDSGVDGTVRAETRDEQAANDLREVVRGFLALARMQVGSEPDLGTVLQGLQIGGVGSTVAITFSLPAQAIDAILSRERRQAD
jgi:hypothetical protein